MSDPMADPMPDPMPDPMSRVFERLLSERIVLLGGELTDQRASQISSALLMLARQDPQRGIALHLNCQAGAASAGLAVFDTMRFVGCPVSTVAMGTAGGIGQFLLTAGTPGRRYALPHARIMLRQLTGALQGRPSEIQAQAEELARLTQRLAELNAEHSGRSVEQITADSARQRWFSAPEAAEYGLVDQVVTRAQLPS